MIELLISSFPAVFRYYQLKRRGEAMTVWNMRTAMFLWAFFAFFLFVLIFYFHPKTYAGLLPFRTVSVVAQTSGPVTQVNVMNGQRVSAGDLLFKIEDSNQKAALKQAEAEFGKLAAAESKAAESLKVAQASLVESTTTLEKQKGDLANAQTLFARNAGTRESVRLTESAVVIAEAGLAAAQAQFSLAQVELTQSIPAQRKAAEAALESAKVALNKTEVRSFTDGVVTQLAMSVGSLASTLIISPAMVIIPGRPDNLRLRVVAGFSQVSRSTIYVGMPAEVACDSNVSLSFRNSILPARIVDIQPAVSTGQVVPSGQLIELGTRTQRGSVLVYLELLNKEQDSMMLYGSGCLVQTYTNNLGGFSGHVIAATGVVKAVGLRLKVWGSLLAGIGLAGGH